MLVKRAKALVVDKVSTSYDMPSDEILASYFLESYYYICENCDPQVLLRSGNQLKSEKKSIRGVPNGFFSVVPDLPDFSSDSEELMIDEALSFAVINYVCFLISKGDKFFKSLADNSIGNYIASDGRELEERASVLYTRC